MVAAPSRHIATRQADMTSILARSLHAAAILALLAVPATW